MNFKNEIAKVEVKLKYFNYSKRTIEIYTHYVLKFLQKVNKYPQHLTPDDFEKYLLNYDFLPTSQH